MEAMTKRAFDFIASLIVLILLIPILIILAILIKLDSAGPVFFCQTRIGRNFKPFKFYKFRTMVLDAEKKGLTITRGGDPRITRIGGPLRRYKIDELPQLLNVLKGDISIVGPRPEVAKYVEIFKHEYEEILKVKPGITDYAAIEFRDEEEILKKYEDPEEGYVKEVLPSKITLYKKYIREKCFWTDMKLIILTLLGIVSSRSSVATNLVDKSHLDN